MPRAKQTVTETPQKQKTFNLTEKQFEEIRNAMYELNDVKIQLEELRGESDISCVMFDIGQAVTKINAIGDKVDGITDYFL